MATESFFFFFFKDSLIHPLTLDNDSLCFDSKMNRSARVGLSQFVWFTWDQIVWAPTQDAGWRRGFCCYIGAGTQLLTQFSASLPRLMAGCSHIDGTLKDFGVFFLNWERKYS